MFIPPDDALKEEYVLSHVLQTHHIQFDGQELLVNKYVKKYAPTAKPQEYKWELNIFIFWYYLAYFAKNYQTFSLDTKT